MSRKFLSRTEAKQRGLTRYFTGKPCKHGHVAERKVSSKICMVCIKTRRKNNDKRRFKTLAYKIWRKKWRAARRTAETATVTKWRAGNADYYKLIRHAHWKVRYEVKRGRLKPQPCKVCGLNLTEAHHPDYTKPLDVEWLCVKHHHELHSKGFSN